MALEQNTLVYFNLADGMDVGTARIQAVDVEIEDGASLVYYKLDVLSGSLATMHRNKDGELWVNAFEVSISPKQAVHNG